MSDGPSFRKGAEAAQEATKGGAFARTEFFKLEDGKTTVLRFLTDADEWIVVDQHQMVPTKPAPEGFSGNWPERMGSICRNDPAFRGVYDECYICDHIVDGKKVRKPSARSWALACLREEVVEDGKIVGLRDLTREVTLPEKDGQPEQTITEKAIVVVNMGYKNFFSVLQGFAGRYGTILDRDYWVKRSGAGTDTTYQIVPLDPIEIDGKRFDLREPEFMARYETSLDIEEVVTERADDKFYARFFDPRVTVSDDDEVKATGDSPPPPQSDIGPEKMAALAERVKGYGTKSSEDNGDDGGDDAKAVEGKKEEAPVVAGGMRNFD